MSGGYQSTPDPIAWQNEQIAAIWATLRAMNGANGLESAVATGPDGFTVYDPATGGRAQFFQGRIRFWDDYDTNPDQYGEILVDPGAGLNTLRFFPPHSDGTGLENSITAQGRRPGQAGHVWVYSDGSIVARVQNALGNLVGTAEIASAHTSLRGGDRLDIITPALGLYELPETSASSNLHLGMVGGEWTVAYVTSSERYKDGIEPLDVNTAGVKAWQRSRWKDKVDVEAMGFDAAPWQHGFIAEQVAEHTPEFVGTDADDEPNSLNYDRMGAVGLHAWCEELEAENASLRSDFADLSARLEALEAT